MMGKVYRLLKDSKRWTQRAYARNKYGHAVNQSSKSAFKFCLEGALYHCYKNPIEREEAQIILSNIEPGYLAFNDNNTHSAILDLVKKAGI